MTTLIELQLLDCMGDDDVMRLSETVRERTKQLVNLLCNELKGNTHELQGRVFGRDEDEDDDEAEIVIRNPKAKKRITFVVEADRVEVIGKSRYIFSGRFDDGYSISVIQEEIEEEIQWLVEEQA